MTQPDDKPSEQLSATGQGDWPTECNVAPADRPCHIDFVATIGGRPVTGRVVRMSAEVASLPDQELWDWWYQNAWRNPVPGEGPSEGGPER